MTEVERIHRFIEAMARKGADQLLFTTGRPVRVRVAGVEQVLLDQAVRTEQIKKLIGPIAGGIELEPPARFRYEAPSGAVLVRLSSVADGLSVVLTPAVEGIYEDGPFTEDTAAPFVLGTEVALASGGSDGIRIAIGEPVQPRPAPDADPPTRVEEEALESASSPAAAPPATHPAPRPAATATGGLEPVPSRRPAAVLPRLLAELEGMGGSDLHLALGSPPFARVDGALRAMAGWPPVATLPPPLDDLSSDRRTVLEVPGNRRVRVTPISALGGAGAVVRPILSSPPSAEALDRSLAELAARTRGLVVVTGGPSSGKSMLLAGLVDLALAVSPRHAIAVEAPVEVRWSPQHGLLRQIELLSIEGSELFGLLAGADPDVVLLSSLEPPNALAAAVRLAERALVFGAVEAPSAIDALERLRPAEPLGARRFARSLEAVLTVERTSGAPTVARLDIGEDLADRLERGQLDELKNRWADDIAAARVEQAVQDLGEP